MVLQNETQSFLFDGCIEDESLEGSLTSATVSAAAAERLLVAAVFSVRLSEQRFLTLMPPANVEAV